MTRSAQIAKAQHTRLTAEGTPTPSKRKAALKRAVEKASSGKALAPVEYREARELAGVV